MKPVFNPEEESRDLGFGSLLSQRQGLRLLNRDGSFNVERRETRWFERLFSYRGLVSMTWPQFFVLILAGYFVINFSFAGFYLLCGPAALNGNSGLSAFARAFFFSVDTFSTIGFGNIVPVGLPANLLVTAEAITGLLSFAVATGLIFARFSRPHMEIAFSRNSVVAPYRGISGWMFRIVNKRDSQLIEVAAKISLSRFETYDGVRTRKFHNLRLEREKVSFFPLAWTVVHPIDENSPLYGWDQRQLIESQAEFFILLTAIDETFSETVHSRSSYVATEVAWNARFAPVYIDDGKQVPRMDWERFHGVERL
ncbi:MAG: ion channel [Acidobacteriaceae bacterium]